MMRVSGSTILLRDDYKDREITNIPPSQNRPEYTIAPHPMPLPPFPTRPSTGAKITQISLPEKLAQQTRESSLRPTSDATPGIPERLSRPLPLREPSESRPDRVMSERGATRRSWGPGAAG